MTDGERFVSRLRETEPPFWGLAAFCLFSPISIAAANAAWVAALLLWVRHSFRQRGQGVSPLRPTAMDKGFALFVLAAVMSLVVSLTPMASLFEFRSLGLIVVFYLFAWNATGPEAKKVLMTCFLGAATLAAAYGTVEYVSGWDLLGHYDPSSNKIGGFFSMHLTFSEVLVLALCVLTGILGWGGLGRRGFALGVAACVLMCMGIFLSGAKGSFLGLGAGWLVIFGLMGRKRLAGFLAALAVLLAALALWRSGFLLDYVISLYRVDASQAAGPADSNTQRLFMWWTGLRMSPMFILNGVGLHAVDAVYPTFRHVLARDPTQWHLHNNFLQLGVTRGLFGLSAFLYLFLLAVRTGYKRFKDGSDPWEKGLTAGVLGALPAFLVCGLTEYNWGDSEVLMALYMIMGLGVSASPSARHGPWNPKESLPKTRFKGREGSVIARGHLWTPWGDPSERIGEERSVVKTVLFSLLVLLLLVLAVFLKPAAVNMGSSVVQVMVGLTMLVLLVRRMAFGGPGRETGPGRCDSWSVAETTCKTDGRSRGLLIRTVAFPGFRQVVACVVVFAAYTFTRGLWMEGKELLAGTDVGGFVVSVILLLNLIAAFFCVRHAKNRTGDPLFDTAVFAAVLLWMMIALGTNVLLRFALGTGGPLDPPFLLLFPLCTMIALLYGSARLVYVQGKVQDLFLSALCLALVLHPFF